jgi:hypothetical protein
MKSKSMPSTCCFLNFVSPYVLFSSQPAAAKQYQKASRKLRLLVGEERQKQADLEQATVQEAEVRSMLNPFA